MFLMLAKRVLGYGNENGGERKGLAIVSVIKNEVQSALVSDRVRPTRGLGNLAFACAVGKLNRNYFIKDRNRQTKH